MCIRDRPKDAEHDLLVLLVREQPTDPVAGPGRSHECQRDRPDRQGDTARGLGQTSAGEDDDEDRQVDGHGEVLEHEDRQEGRGLAVAEPVQVAQQLGDDA